MCDLILTNSTKKNIFKQIFLLQLQETEKQEIKGEN